MTTVLAAGVLLAVAACSSDAGEAPAKDQPQTAAAVTIAIPGDEGTLTPYTYTTGYPGYNLLTLVYDSLVVLDTSNEVTPLLATELTVSPDSTVFTLPLRTGVTWHDGKPFSADDVVFTIDYYREYDTVRFASPLAGVDSVQVRDGAVVITLSQPDPEFPVRLLADMPILPRHVWSSITEPEKAPVTAAVGTGPYRLASYEPDRRYELTANTAYPIGKPRIDTLTVSVVPEQQTALAALRTGEVQMTAGTVPANLIDQLSGQQGVTVATGSNFGSTLLAFNDGKAPFDRVEVRRAIATAIDTTDLVDTVLLGKGTLGSPGFWHPEAPGANTSLTHTHDPAAASAALDAIGATPGPDGVRVLDGKPLAFDLLVYANNPDRVRTAELITEMLAKVGVKTAVRAMDADSVDAKVWPDFDVANGRDYDLALWGWSAPTMFDYTRLAGLVASDPKVGRLNVTGIRDADLDAAATALNATTTLDDRKAAAGELQQLIADKAPFVTLYYPAGAYAYRSDVFAGWTYQQGRGCCTSTPWSPGPTEVSVASSPVRSRTGLVRAVLGRAGGYLAVFAVALTITFLLPRALPGGPLRTLGGADVADLDPAVRAQVAAAYGLDQPLPVQFWRYLRDLARLDLGESFNGGRPVAEAIADALPWTLLLVGTSVLLTAAIGVALGVIAGLRRGRGKGNLLLAGVLLLDAAPAFWVGMLAILFFGVHLGALPTFGATTVGHTGLAAVGDVATHLVLPVGVLVVAGIGQFFLVTRFSVASALHAPHVEHAHARGIPHRRVVARHLLRPALLPVHTQLMIELGWLVGGALVVETVFAYPGLGRLTFDAIQGRDYPTMQATFLTLVVTVLVMNALADLTYPLLDPRTRTRGAA
ncbi:ABC transporter substrate-binding protein [Micromonospora endophytica]|uniref:ABC transporter substrate-binding protein n=1 Tax=Micromonospora endophytica TaxID=515350 RepID=UPI001BB3933D|nr:ABC transporter substrate-binding protein [Micromonospora endophytica]